MDINGLVLKMKSKQKSQFDIKKEYRQLDALLSHPPFANETYKLMSVGGGFSIAGIIKYVASKEKIKNLYISTFRIGKKQFDELCNINIRGQLERAFFITSQTQKKVDTKIKKGNKEYNYFDYICSICEKKKWEIVCYDNHSKICLMQTDKNWYVIETSSNLNENPKMEHFSFENDKKLFEWYLELFKNLLKK